MGEGSTPVISILYLVEMLFVVLALLHASHYMLGKFTILSGARHFRGVYHFLPASECASKLPARINGQLNVSIAENYAAKLFI